MSKVVVALYVVGMLATIGIVMGPYTDGWDENRKTGARLILASPVWPLMLAWFVLSGAGRAFRALIREADLPRPRLLRSTRHEVGTGQLSVAPAQGGELSNVGGQRKGEGE